MKKTTLLITAIIALATIINSCQKPPKIPTGQGNKLILKIDSTTNINYRDASIYTQINDLTNNKITQHGHCWGTTDNPLITGNKTQLGELKQAGSFTSHAIGLQPSTKYYAKGYVQFGDVVVYSTANTFTTKEAEIPIVETAPITNITETTAISGGTIPSDGGLNITAKGVCWATSQNPTIAGNHTDEGASKSNFVSQMAELALGTTYYVRAYATNSLGTGYGAEETFTSGAIAPTLTTATITNIATTSATSGGNISDNGGSSITAKGVCWSITENPTIANNHSADGTGISAFTSQITNLTANTTYYVKAYATNAMGTSYGNQLNLTTNQLGQPIISTIAITNIFETTATSGGNISDDGGENITAKGVCWSTSQNPTTANEKTTDGIGTSNFTSQITGLTLGTTYYVRAYATNSIGTSYGNQESFTSGTVAPTLTTTAITNITSSTATSGGNITDNGGATITTRGVCWSTSQNPTTDDDKTDDGTDTGSFVSNITNLETGTTYYVRAYATNASGTSYGEELSFTTDAILPTVTTTEITNITDVSASSGGNNINNGGANIIAKGVCWSTSQNPTITDSYTEDGSGTTDFTSNIIGLSFATTYYVRAYATNSIGISYGNQQSFTTLSLQGHFATQMIEVQGGTFTMGCTSEQSDCGGNESPTHDVTLSTYSIGKYEVTQAQWYAVMGTSPSSFSGCDDCPVEQVSWDDIQDFLQTLNQLTGENYRLPTEAEWEYAARGGTSATSTLYSGSNTIDDVAWYRENSYDMGSSHADYGTNDVGTKNANELGIYDMTGNVWEWCNDWHDADYYGTSPTNNPQGASSGSYRVLRGGGWGSYSQFCRVAYRYYYSPSGSSSGLGFRLAFSL